MKKFFVTASAFVLCFSLISSFSNTMELSALKQGVQADEEPSFVFIELSREEFVSRIAANQMTTIEAADAKIAEVDFKAAITNIDLTKKALARGLILYYGYFDTKGDTKAGGAGTSSYTYGCYVSYYYPDSASPWSSRKFNAVHDTYLWGHYRDFFITESISVTGIISSSLYTLTLSAKFRQIRNMPFNYWVTYTVSSTFWL